MTRSPWAVAADILDPPPAPDTFTRLGYTPTERQAELHGIDPYAAGGPFDVLYGGAAGGGKTKGLLLEALRRAHTHPGLTAWLVRETYRQLQDSFIAELEAINHAAAIGGRWNGSEFTLRLPNGSKLLFRHARNLADAAEMLSAECQLLVIDERSRLDPKVVDQLTLRVRSGRPHVPVIGVRSGSNPGGPGHSRLKADFVDPAPLGRRRIPILDDEASPIRVDDDGRILQRWYLPARVADNPHVDASYRARLDLLPPDMRAAYRDGDWSRFEGMRFTAFQPHIHVIAPEQLPVPLAGIRRGLGVDYGGAAPFAAVWGAVVNEQLVVYRELHQAGLTPTEQARRILGAERDGERIPGRAVPTWLDPSTWARDPERPIVKPIRPDDPPPGSIADRYQRAGVAVRKAFNDRVAGWSLIDELLGTLPDGRPRTLIYGTCTNVIRSLSGAPRDERDPEDVDDGYGDDHALDAFRYLACGLTRRGVGRPAGRHRNGDRVPALTGRFARPDVLG